MAKGVATLMDSIFLFMIAAVAAAILFTAAANYGKSLRIQVQNLLLDYYARQAVRTLSTASIVRPGCTTPDYLLAYIKEKVHYGTLADPSTMMNIGQVLSKIMQPLSNNYDYALVITTGSTADSNAYVFVWYHKKSGSSYASEESCYATTYGTYQSWLGGVVKKGVGVESYSVPVRFDVGGGYSMGRIIINLWPAGLDVDFSKLGTSNC